MYKQYAELAAGERNVIFGGRLAEYKYYDMNDVIKSALERAEKDVTAFSREGRKCLIRNSGLIGKRCKYGGVKYFRYYV